MEDGVKELEQASKKCLQGVAFTRRRGKLQISGNLF